MLREYRPVSLEELDAARLMNRIDTKYIFHIDQLESLLLGAADHYRILAIGDRRIFRYNSLYFDTPALKSYLDHHNGIRPRYKVRFREYEDSGCFFLEVKSKSGKGRTSKVRTAAERIEEVLSESSIAYIQKNTPFDVSDLGPSLSTRFERITLMGTGIPERITIDVKMEFRHGREERDLPFLAVCEVKRDQLGGATPFMQILKASRIYPASISKYCLGTLLLKEGVKYNLFKSSMLTINKLENVYRPYPAAG